MNTFRLIFGLPIAALVTLGLFALMAGMINKPVETNPQRQIEIPDITYEPEPESKPIEKIKPPSLPDAPEPPDTKVKGEKGNPDDFIYDPDPGGVIIDKSPINPGQGVAVTPTIRIAPEYPESCQSRAGDGAVLVEFDVTPQGNVVNPRIIESSHRCFDRTVIRAVSRWKYTPSYQGGRAVARRGVVEKFVFQLTD